MASQGIVQLYAELEDYEPKIWRRFQIPERIVVARLGYIVMTLFEMQANHLFCFDIPSEENFLRSMRQIHRDAEFIDFLEKNTLFEEKDKVWHLEVPLEGTDYVAPDDGIEHDATRVNVKAVLHSPGDVMLFQYDFGDEWVVKLVYEKRFEDKDLPGRELPRVLEGEGFGIIEDCGGTYGLAELAKAFQKKKGPKYRELSKWLGRGDIDLVSFDLDDMNFRLKKLPRIFSDCYEWDLSPTQRSIDILERKYLKKGKPRKEADASDADA